MNETFNKVLIFGAIGVLGIAIGSLIFGGDDERNYNVSVQSYSSIKEAADGLDLKAVGALVKEVSTPQELEKLLNDESKGINNLDLNEDDKVDYIKVTEFGEGKVKAFSLTVDTGSNEEQEIATIRIEETNEGKAYVETHGNSQIYGHNHYYRSHFGLSDFLFWSYLTRGHSYYRSPYYYGHYPSYYRSYRTVPQTTYQRKISSNPNYSQFRNASSSKVSQKVVSPNANKTATNIKAPLRNPTQTQKTFQKTNPSKQVRSGGFGKKATPSKPSVKTSGGFFRSSGSSGGK